MSEYTIEELERMLEEARNEEANKPEIISLEDLEDNEIKQSLDVEDIIIMSNDGYDTMISHIWKSQLINKILIHNYLYVEEIEFGNIVGRSCCGKNRYILSYENEIPTQQLQIIQQRQINRNL